MKIPLLLSLLLVIAVAANAQHNISPVLAMEVQNIPLNIDSTTMEITDTTQLKTFMLITVKDTVRLSSIEVRLKRTAAGASVFQKRFVYDVAGNFADGTSYLRQAYDIKIGLGKFYGLRKFHAEVRITRPDGSVTDPIIYSR